MGSPLPDSSLLFKAWFKKQTFSPLNEKFILLSSATFMNENISCYGINNSNINFEVSHSYQWLNTVIG